MRGCGRRTGDRSRYSRWRDDRPIRQRAGQCSRPGLAGDDHHFDAKRRGAGRPHRRRQEFLGRCRPTRPHRRRRRLCRTLCHRVVGGFSRDLRSPGAGGRGDQRACDCRRLRLGHVRRCATDVRRDDRPHRACRRCPIPGGRTRDMSLCDGDIGTPRGAGGQNNQSRYRVGPRMDRRGCPGRRADASGAGGGARTRSVLTGCLRGHQEQLHRPARAAIDAGAATDADVRASWISEETRGRIAAFLETLARGR